MGEAPRQKIEREAFIIEEIPNKGSEGCNNTRCTKEVNLILLFVLSLTSFILSVGTAIFYFTKLEGNTSTRNVSEQIASLHTNVQFDPHDSVLKSSGERYSHLKVAQQQSLIGQTSLLTSGSFAFAHKALLADFSSLDSSDDGDSFQLLELDHKDHHVSYETFRRVKLLRYGIQILYPGIYFVYKSIFFTPYSRDPCSKLGTFKSQLMLNSTSKNNKRRTRTCLLQTAHTCCPNCRDDRETTFSGGSFLLHKGDVIEVEVSSVDLIDVASDVSFLGLMMIAPET